jgi:hypothetical protein
MLGKQLIPVGTIKIFAFYLSSLFDILKISKTHTRKINKKFTSFRHSSKPIVYFSLTRWQGNFVRHQLMRVGNLLG